MSSKSARGSSGRNPSRSSTSSPGGGASGRGRWLLGLIVVAVAAGAAWWWTLGPGAADRPVTPAERERTIARMTAGEVLILDLNPVLRKVSKGVNNMRLPDARARAVFADEVQVQELAGNGPADAELAASGLGIRLGAWPPERSAKKVARADLSLWTPFFSRIDYWDWAKFYFMNSRFTDEAMKRFETQVGFKGRARLADGRVCGVEAHQLLTWVPGPPDTAGKATWVIAEWKQVDFKLLEAAKLPFEDVLARALPDAATRARAVISLHERYVYDMILQLRKPPEERTSGPPHKYFFPATHDHHPAVSIVDIDHDGWDDVFLCVQWGPSQLFRNKGDGTFEEVAARYGLDVPEHTSTAAFADFDNDGDTDVMIGRTLSPSIYLANENGHYVDRSDTWTDGPLPSLVSSLTVADYDGDGRLDVYFGTYASDLMRSAGNVQPGGAIQPMSDPNALFLREFLPPADAAELERRYHAPDWHAFKNAAGPPNVLLHNTGGGRFARVVDTPLRLFRHTFQATWGDYDNDGDVDLYVANDFAPNNLFRNDGGKFVDVTAETQTADVGFGMGATWGDYDRDGRQDLYVTNMYSKAGNRILAQLPWIDPMIKQMASGNTMFHNAASGPWTKVSGLVPGTMQVEFAEWGWGSQYVDLDNDGWLDLYAPDGHYTPPKEVQAEVDL